MTGNEVVLNYTMPVLLETAAIEKAGVLRIVQYGGPWLTVPELLFEKKQLIPALQELLSVRASECLDAARAERSAQPYC